MPEASESVARFDHTRAVRLPFLLNPLLLEGFDVMPSTISSSSDGVRGACILLRAEFGLMLCRDESLGPLPRVGVFGLFKDLSFFFLGVGLSM